MKTRTAGLTMVATFLLVGSLSAQGTTLFSDK